MPTIVLFGRAREVALNPTLKKALLPQLASESAPRFLWLSSTGADFVEHLMIENWGAAASLRLGSSKALQPMERLLLKRRVSAASLRYPTLHCMAAGSPW